MSDEAGPVVFLSGCDVETVQHLPGILGKLKDSLPSNYGETWCPAVVSCKAPLAILTNVQGFPEYLVSVCRRYNLLKNERATLLSPMDQLVTLQLCLAERNHQDHGDFDVETSVVLHAGKAVTNNKLMIETDVTSSAEDAGIESDYEKTLKHCNYVDLCDIISKIKLELEHNEDLKKELSQTAFIFLNVPKRAAERHMVELLVRNREVYEAAVEIPLEAETDITVSCSPSSLDALLSNSNTMASTVKKSSSLTEVFVRQVYLAYLDLLVNSRSELALARVINVPERKLSHSAFTDLKHEAKQKNMTMYQTAVSYVMKIRIGGKGYAPDANHRLAQHVKGLGEFVTLMHRMETIIEEASDIRSACCRVINVLRKEIVKCRDSKLRVSSIESVADQLKDQITRVIETIETMVAKSPEKAACNGGSLTGRKTRRALRFLLDKLTSLDDNMSTLDHLCDVYSSQRTPVRFQSILSQFRSPDEELDSPDEKCNMSLAERVMNKEVQKQTPAYAKRYKASMDWAEPVHNVGLNQDDDVSSQSQIIVIPSKTVVHASSSSVRASKVLESLLDQENATGEDAAPTLKPASKPKAAAQKVTKDNKKKRPLEAAASSQPAKKKKQQPEKSCRRKLLPQVKGQQQLTQFFRV